MSLLCVDDLRVQFRTTDGLIEAVRNLSFRLEKGESLAIVGESGSGKSQSMAAILGLLAENGVASGSVRLDGKEILNASPKALRKIRGRRISVVFQDPMTALNPYVTIGSQLSRVLIEQRDMGREMATAEVARMLDAVRLPAAKSRLNSYPHEFSGGMRQRVLIAASLLCRPDILIADEPTTALDVTVQASILDMLRDLQESFKTALILISHDLAVVAGTCDRLIVMDRGVAIEDGSTTEVFANPQTACTQALLEAVPRLDTPVKSRPRIDRETAPLMEALDLTVRYPMPKQGWRRKRHFSAVRQVSLQIFPRETVGIVGESGCGKSSLARALVNRGREAGQINYLNRDYLALRGADKRRSQRDIQFVFQDPLGSLNPRLTIEQIVGEPAEVHQLVESKAACRERVVKMLQRVGLDETALNRYPHEFSGGQCQRIGIARALMTQPRLLVCDEALSALDVTVQASILDLLADLQRELSLGIVFIAHDLAVVRAVSDTVMVMYLGRVVEQGPAEQIYKSPAHPYTRALLDAVPVPDPAIERQREYSIDTLDLPAPWNQPSGCAYRSRCPLATDQCQQQRPVLEITANHENHRVACFNAIPNTE
ncbi:MAG: dipeptide ABC transporter ATP-binding protein [Woeseiaceae bacterium]